MKIIKNEKLIARNAKIGKYSSFAGLIVIAGMLFFFVQSLQKPESVSNETSLGMLVVLLFGMILSQVSMYFANRWGRRPDEAMDKALKGLPGDFNLYHYSAPASHLLVGPAGVWILLPYHVRGRVTFTKNRWRISGGGFAQSYMRLFGQESMGRPDLEAGNETAALRKFLEKNSEGGMQPPPIQAALIFLDDKAEIDAEGAPLPALPVKKLKEFLRKTAKETPFPAAELARVKEVLPKE